MYVRTSSEGEIFNFRIHTGTIERCEGQPDLQASGNTVMHLMSKIPRNNWYKLFIDNWYTGVPLVSSALPQQGIAVVGTVRSNRLKGCLLSNDKVLRLKLVKSMALNFVLLNG